MDVVTISYAQYQVSLFAPQFDTASIRSRDA